VLAAGLDGVRATVETLRKRQNRLTVGFLSAKLAGPGHLAVAHRLQVFAQADEIATDA